MSDNEYQDILRDAARTEKNPYGYYAYLVFEDGKLVAAELNDDYTAFYDYKNKVVGANLWDVMGDPWDEDWEKNLIAYLRGEMVPYPQFIYDGVTPHPQAGELHHWEGMESWYTTILTNDVMACINWMDDEKFAGWGATLVPETEYISYAGIQKRAAAELEEYKQQYPEESE